jgi:hypothetical protein
MDETEHVRSKEVHGPEPAETQKMQSTLSTASEGGLDANGHRSHLLHGAEERQTLAEHSPHEDATAFDWLDLPYELNLFIAALVVCIFVASACQCAMQVQLISCDQCAISCDQCPICYKRWMVRSTEGDL